MQLSPLKSDEISPQQLFSKVRPCTHPSSLLSCGTCSQQFDQPRSPTCWPLSWIACRVSKVGIPCGTLSDLPFVLPRRQFNAVEEKMVRSARPPPALTFLASVPRTVGLQSQWQALEQLTCPQQWLHPSVF